MKNLEFNKIAVAPGVSGLIFDCDGTLADTMPVHWDAWKDSLSSFGVDCSVEVLESYSGVPSREIILSLNSRFGWNIDPEEFCKIKQKEIGERLKYSKPIKPVVDLVLSLQGKLPMSVVSGGSRTNVMSTLDGLNLTKYFCCIVTADDGLPPKPSPEPFLYASRFMGLLPQQCQVFEDADLGIHGALAAGMVATDVRIAL